MAIGLYLKAVVRYWLAWMNGPISLLLLFIPQLVPDFAGQYLGGSTLVWIIAFLCLMISTYRAWLSEHRARLADRLDPLIGDVRQLRQLWDKIQYDHKDSPFISFPLAGFDVEKWEEVHKQLSRLYFWTGMHADRAKACFAALGITETAPVADVMNNRNAQSSLNALDYTRLLEKHAALLAHHRTRIAG